MGRKTIRMSRLFYMLGKLLSAINRKPKTVCKYFHDKLLSVNATMIAGLLLEYINTQSAYDSIQEGTSMFEYKIEIYKVKEAEKEMNRLASEGWRVIEVMPNAAMGYGMVVAYEREKKEQA